MTSSYQEWTEVPADQKAATVQALAQSLGFEHAKAFFMTRSQALEAGEWCGPGQLPVLIQELGSGARRAQFLALKLHRVQ